MVNALPEMIEHVKSLLRSCPYDKMELKILAGYDTQFELTDGYVSNDSNPPIIQSSSLPPSSLPGQLVGHIGRAAASHLLAGAHDSACVPGMSWAMSVGVGVVWPFSVWKVVTLRSHNTHLKYTVLIFVVIVEITN
jgi:hypothetical protein